MTFSENQHPQVALFGSIAGNWREHDVIPLLDELGVTYYDPRLPQQPTWTEDMGRREADVMANCETILMVFNNETPAFGGFAEAGWAALSCLQRGQTFILCVEQGYVTPKPWWVYLVPGTRRMVRAIDEYANRTRFLTQEHAQRLADKIAGLIVVDSIEAVLDELRKLYG